MSVKSQGACDADEPQNCGGIAGLTCDGADLYCHYEPAASCGAGDQMGICRERPQACTREFDPTCGCDGVTYSNGCSANASGVSVRSRGACDEDVPDGCGGIAGLTCDAEGTYCHYEPAQSCGAGDQMGTCREMPQICTRQFDPVCGCDDRTHGNACDANSRGVSVKKRGACDD